MTKSAASVKIPSGIKALAISPKSVKTAGMVMTCALDKDATGDMVITGHTEINRVTVLRYKTWRRKKNRASLLS